jgi:hypothetical protein
VIKEKLIMWGFVRRVFTNKLVVGSGIAAASFTGYAHREDIQYYISSIRIPKDLHYLDEEEDRLGLRFGTSFDKGKKAVMEDYCSAVELPSGLAFAIFDGHGGTLAAEFANHNICNHLSHYITNCMKLSFTKLTYKY